MTETELLSLIGLWFILVACQIVFALLLAVISTDEHVEFAEIFPFALILTMTLASFIWAYFILH